MFNSLIYIFSKKRFVGTGEVKTKRVSLLMTLTLTVSPTEASVESLCVDMADVLSFGPMKQLSLTISSSVPVYLLFPRHVRLIQMRILHSFDLCNSLSTCSSLKLSQDILVFPGPLE